MIRPLAFARLVGLLALVFTTISLGRPAAALATPAADIKTILMGAIMKTALAPSHQLELTVSATGLPPQMGGALGGLTPSQEVSLISVTGKRRGNDLQVKVGGALTTLAGLPPAASLEFIQAGGKSYIHGPLPMFGASENKWYALDGASSGDFAQRFQSSADKAVDYKAMANIDLSFITLLSKQTLHGQQCDVYGTTDKNAIIRALRAATPNSPSGELDRIEAGEIKFWVCDDGYFHQAWVSLEGTSPAMPNAKGAVRIRLSLFDYNGSFTIAAPLNAARLEPPKLGGPVFQTLPSSGPAAPASGPSAAVFNGGNIRLRPGAKGQVLGQLRAGQTVTLLERTLDGSWLLVKAPEATGWVHVSLLRVAPGATSRLLVNGEASAAAPAGELLSATVAHGGNQRAAPGVAGVVLGQVDAGDSLQLLARTRNGAWYYVKCGCGTRGWVHASLLKVEPQVARKVPLV